MAVYRMKNGKCVKRLTAKEMEVLVSHGIIDDPQVKEYLEAEKELKLKREALHQERGVEMTPFGSLRLRSGDAAQGTTARKRRSDSDEGNGFAPRSPELYAYLDGLYKKTRWLNSPPADTSDRPNGGGI
jgi:hypothetical protein